MALYLTSLLEFRWREYEEAQERSSIRAREAHLPIPLRKLRQFQRGVVSTLSLPEQMHESRAWQITHPRTAFSPGSRKLWDDAKARRAERAEQRNTAGLAV